MYSATLKQFSRTADIPLPELRDLVARFGYQPVGKQDGEDAYSLQNLFATLRKTGHQVPILGISPPPSIT